MSYGTTRQTFDHQICKTQSQFRMHWSGKGNIDNDPATALYLKREDGSQGFYIPEQTVIGIHGIACVSNVTDAYSTSTVEHIEFNALAFRDTSGNVTVVVDPATPQTEVIATITVTANTTVQAIELRVSHVGTPDETAIAVSAVMEGVIVYEPNIPTIQAGGAAALATAE